MSDPLRVALRLAQVFEALHVRYLLGGALASAILGEPRATEDIDLAADLTAADVDALVSALGQEFYVPLGALQHAVDQGTSFNIIHMETMRKVDIFVAHEDPSTARSWIDAN